MRPTKKRPPTKIRSLATWRKWVLIGDEYTCQICKVVSRHNEAHHLYSKEHYPKKRYDLKNGVCLCPRCHTGLHMWNGGFSKRCTPKTFENYKRYLLEKDVRKYRKIIVYTTIILGILLEISKKYSFFANL